MNGNNILIDTNIAIALLDGDKEIANLLNGNFIKISFITELELLCKPNLSNAERIDIYSFINDCTIIEINNLIKQITINLRQNYKIKLPDAIIAASAIAENIPFISKDQDFSKIEELNFVYIT